MPGIPEPRPVLYSLSQLRTDPEVREKVRRCLYVEVFDPITWSNTPHWSIGAIRKIANATTGSERLSSEDQTRENTVCFLASTEGEIEDIHAGVDKVWLNDRIARDGA